MDLESVHKVLRWNVKLLPIDITLQIAGLESMISSKKTVLLKYANKEYKMAMSILGSTTLEI